MDVLKILFYAKPGRFLLHIAFLVLPVLSYGQSLHTANNTLPLSGLENVFVAQQKNIEPLLFVASDAIISKSATDTFFVNGSIQTEGFLVAQTDIIKNPTPLPEKTQIKIKPTTEVAAAEVKQSNNQLDNSYLPCKKNPLQQEIYCAAVATVCCPSTPVLKKKNNNPYQHQQAGSNLLQLFYKTRFYAVIVTAHATSSYGKNVTQFSSRPPPSPLTPKGGIT